MAHRPSPLLAWSLVLFVLLVASAAAADEPTFEDFVEPLRVEAGPLISPALGPLPRTDVYGAAGVLYRSRERGRASYASLSTRLVLGGEWNPDWLGGRFGLGGSLVAFQSLHDHVDLPPVIDEWTSFYDLGPLRLRARVTAFRLATGPLELAVTPFLRLGLPTDTSRIRQHRRIPVRRVIDDRVIEAPYFLIEPGVSVGGTIGPMSWFTHQAPIVAPIHQVETHVLWSMHYGVGIRIVEMFEIAAEISGLLRATDDFQERKLSAWSVDPGIRLITGSWEWEISSRFGISDQADVPFGIFTLGFAVCWVPGADRGDSP